MIKETIIDPNVSIVLLILVSVFFAFIGIFFTTKINNKNSYLNANRNIGSYSLTTSFVASALGTWILFGPSSAATWGGLGAVVGYSLGTAFPLLILIFFGKKIRTLLPKGNTLTEFMKKKFGIKIFKFVFSLMIFYMMVFLCAEVTALSTLINFISNIPLWISAVIVLITTLVYTFHGGLKSSIFTDNIQFIFIIVLLFICFVNAITINENNFALNHIYEKNHLLLSSKSLVNYTAGFTFFIAVAATNLFHQGNWQRVFAAKNYHVLKKSLINSFLIIVPIVFLMGMSGLVAISNNENVNPDLAFFSLFLSKNNYFFAIIILILAISLTMSTLDTLINAISSLLVVDGKYFLNSKKISINSSKVILIALSIIVLFVASKGYSILYLFLLADLFCCAAVVGVFSSFKLKNISEKRVICMILCGLICGLLLFPSPQFDKSFLVGIIFEKSFFPNLIIQNLLFFSFLLATTAPIFFVLKKFE